MATLALVGCGPRLEIALAAEGLAAPGVIALAGVAPRSELIIAAIDLLLRAAGLARPALRSIVVTRGPGSFTGVRVALSTAQGLALALAVGARGCPSLLAQAARSDVDERLAVQPARRGFAYAQPFAGAGAEARETAAPTILSLDDVAASRLPVVAPAGMALPPATRLAAATMSTAEALVALHERGRPEGDAPLVPAYLEPPPARPGTYP